MFGNVAAAGVFGGRININLPANETWVNSLKGAINDGDADEVSALLALQGGVNHIDVVNYLCQQAINQRRPDDIFFDHIICKLISFLPPDQRQALFEDKTVIPSPVVRANNVELAKFYLIKGFEPQIAPSDAHYFQRDIEDCMFPYQFEKKLRGINNSADFVEQLDTSHASHHDHDHGAHGDDSAGEHEYKVEGNFAKAQKEIDRVITTVFANLKAGYQNEAKDICLLYAFMKAVDQAGPVPTFTEKPEREKFEKLCHITSGGQFISIENDQFAVPDGKAFLVKEFKLDSFWAKYALISQNSSASRAEKVLDVADLTLAAFFDGAIKIATAVYKYRPSFLTTFLAVGATIMFLRAIDNQMLANLMRDNVGALTEAFSFFVLVNGFLDNLFHSTALIAPSCVAIAACDKLLLPTWNFARSKLNCSASASNSNSTEGSVKETVETSDTSNDIEQGLGSEMAANTTEVVSGSYSNLDAPELLKSLNGIRHYFSEDAMWTGLQNAQLAYQENHLEANLQRNINTLIERLGELVTPSENVSASASTSSSSSTTPININQLLHTEFKQTLRDMSEMMQAYVDVCEKKNPNSGIKGRFESFYQSFARDGILFSDASDEAVWAAFCMRHEAGLVGWDDRIKASFPELPSAREVLIAAGVIGVFLTIIQIYKAATGSDKEPISSYLLDLPTHAFKLIHLDQLYDNLGGGAASTEWFKKFFAYFNLTENSSHFYIAAIPIIKYMRSGSKMFEGLHHAPFNWAAYLGHQTNVVVKQVRASAIQGMAGVGIPV